MKGRPGDALLRHDKELEGVFRSLRFVHNMIGPESGVVRILAERQRQIQEEGWTKTHDDTHDFFEMTKAAICYAHHSTLMGHCVWQTEYVDAEVGTPGEQTRIQRAKITRLPEGWPEWDRKWWKPEPRVPGDGSPMINSKDAIRMLEKAGALIAAEIDRLSRLERKA
jgi:hypothetical protein